MESHTNKKSKWGLSGIRPFGNHRVDQFSCPSCHLHCKRSRVLWCVALHWLWIFCLLYRYKDLNTNISLSHKREHTTSFPNPASGTEVLSSADGSIYLRAQSLEDWPQAKATWRGSTAATPPLSQVGMNNPSTSSSRPSMLLREPLSWRGPGDVGH